VTRIDHTDVDVIDVTQWPFASNPYLRSRLMTLNGQYRFVADEAIICCCSLIYTVGLWYKVLEQTARKLVSLVTTQIVCESR
jgi:hypothetical protein